MAASTITSQTTLSEVTDLTFPWIRLRVLIMPARHYIHTDITKGKRADGVNGSRMQTSSLRRFK